MVCKDRREEISGGINLTLMEGKLTGTERTRRSHGPDIDGLAVCRSTHPPLKLGREGEHEPILVVQKGR